MAPASRRATSPRVRPLAEHARAERHERDARRERHDPRGVGNRRGDRHAASSSSRARERLEVGHERHATQMSVDVLRWENLLAGEELAYLGTEAERDARFAPLPDGLAVDLGVDRLYAHQRAAWDAAQSGENVIVTTGTASGKTLAFNLPVLDAIARDAKTRALYLYP